MNLHRDILEGTADVPRFPMMLFSCVVVLLICAGRFHSFILFHESNHVITAHSQIKIEVRIKLKLNQSFH
jgi:hypothetical protein